ncbi:MAG: methionyl-tRNA formyltransferase [Armatimonadetes bacterium]|nr:methionyl-tRNA formyltransferase [Armatimonadota bacterium]
MRVVFFGTPQVAAPYLDAVAEAGHEIPAVVTQPDRPAGRGRRLQAGPVKQAALARGLPVLQPQRADEPEFIAEITALRPEVGVVVAYGQILRPALLECASVAFINVHYSLLPQLRGAAPVYGALRQGLAETGVTVQYLAQELDAGDIILQRSLKIDEDDDRGTLTDRLTKLGVPALVDALSMLADGNAPRVPQDHSKATYVGKVRPEDCRVDWNAASREGRNLVRACTPWPGAWCLLDGRRIRIERVEIVREDLMLEGEPGTVVELHNDKGPVIRTGDGGVAIRQLRPEGKRSMTGAEFLRGARLEVGVRFE